MSPYEGKVNARFRAAIILFIGYLSCAMYRLNLSIVLPDIISKLKINEFQAGTLYSMSFWSLMALLIPAGWMADRFGRKKMFLLGYLFLTIGVLSFALLPDNYFLLAVALIISGIGSGILAPTYYSIIGNLLKHARGFAIGFADASPMMGAFLGSLLVGIFAAFHRWRIAFIIMGTIQILMLLIQLTALRDLLPTKNTPLEMRERHMSFFEILRIRNIIISCISILLSSMGFFAVTAWLPTLLVLRGSSVTEAGLLLGLFFMSGAVSTPTFGRLSEKIGKRETIFYLNMIAAAFAIMLFLTKHPLYSAVYIILLGVTINPYWALLLTVTQESVPEEDVSISTGLVQTAGYMGAAAGPIVSGALIPLLEIDNALLFSVTSTTILSGLIALLIRKIR